MNDNESGALDELLSQYANPNPTGSVGIIRDSIGFKTCPKCGDTKPLEDFHKDRTKSGGRKSACKKCENFDRQGRGYHA